MSFFALRKRASELEAQFERECADNGYADRWDYYRALEAGAKAPESVAVADRAWTDALHAFYAARDGENGFLGGKGL